MRVLADVLREWSAPAAAAIVGLAIVGPFYHHHFYQTEGAWMPISMEWDRPEDLAAARQARDRDPIRFVKNVLRTPIENPADPQEPLLDSFFGLEWLQTWMRDSWLGKQPPPSLAVSKAYRKSFVWIVPFGTLWFFLRQRYIPPSWRQFGWLLLGLTCVFIAAALSFGWKYPLWDWRIFKAKYMSPGLLWIPYATAVVFSDTWLSRLRPLWNSLVMNVGFYSLVAFMFVNHLLPVY